MLRLIIAAGIIAGSLSAEERADTYIRFCLKWRTRNQRPVRVQAHGMWEVGQLTVLPDGRTWRNGVEVDENWKPIRKEVLP